MDIGNYLVGDYPLIVLPKLAVAVGLNEAIMLQQIHYWLKKAESNQNSDHYVDGRWWVHNSLESWQANFPFWSLPTIRRIIADLEKRGLIITRRMRAKRMDQTKWYTIDYQALQALLAKNDPPPANLTNESDQNDQVLTTDQSDQMLISIKYNKKHINPPQPSAVEEQGSAGKHQPKGKSKYVVEMEYLEGVFAEARGVPRPDWEHGQASGLMKTWRLPLREILKFCGGDVEWAAQVIRAVVAEMRRDGLTFSRPVQIVKKVESWIADHHGPPAPYAPPNLTQMRLQEEI